MSRTVYFVWFLCCLEKIQTLDGEMSKFHARDHQITKSTHWTFYIKLFILVSILPIFSLFQPLKTFWASDIITLFGINACTTATTQGSPLKLNETEIKEVKDMADSQSTAMRRWLYISERKGLMFWKFWTSGGDFIFLKIEFNNFPSSYLTWCQVSGDEECSGSWKALNVGLNSKQDQTFFHPLSIL